MVELPDSNSHLIAGEPELELQDDTLAAYLREISSVPLLTAEEEITLSRAIRRAEAALTVLQDGSLETPKQTALWLLVLEGQQAQLKMAEANLRLVVSVAKRYANQGIPFADLIQEGNIGLLRAVRKFDYRQQCRFSTYATCWIRQAMGRTVAQNSRSVRLPAHIAESMSTVRNVSRRLQQELSRDPTVDELVLEIGILTMAEREEIEALLKAREPLPPRLLKRLLKARERVQLLLSSMLEPVSLETPAGDDDDSLLGDMVPNSQASSPADETLAQMLKECLNETLSVLSPREQIILRYRFGLDDADVLTLGELGEQLGITRERVRQIEQGALRKLRLGECSKQLAPYLAS
jgi:RNA polymerase primary sigma factor